VDTRREEGHSLDVLRALTDKLPAVPYETMVQRVTPERIDLRLVQGRCTMIGLYAEPDMSVAMAEVDADSRMDPHTHGQSEYFIVLRGQMVAHIDGIGHSTEAGGMYHVPPNVSHWVEWPVATKVLVVTIPQSEGFPNARQ
jgi:quercetin dioxygenase-like cupin family protein